MTVCVLVIDRTHPVAMGEQEGDVSIATLIEHIVVFDDFLPADAWTKEHQAAFPERWQYLQVAVSDPDFALGRRPVDHFDSIEA